MEICKYSIYEQKWKLTTNLILVQGGTRGGGGGGGGVRPWRWEEEEGGGGHEWRVRRMREVAMGEGGGEWSLGGEDVEE